MAISSDQNRRTYSGDGSSAVFSYPYEFHNDSDLAVLIYNSSRSTITVAQALTTNYNISGTKDTQGRYLNGANIVFNSSPATGDEISIFGSTSVNSNYALGFNEHISRPDLIKAMDHLVLITQRLNNQVTRSMRLPDSYPYTSFDPRLPERILPSSVLATNSSGLAIELLFTVGSSSLVPSGGIDVPLIGQGLGVPPVFSALNLVSGSSTIGNLPVSKGGTAHSSFVQASMVYASGNNILSFVSVGGGDVPFVGNPGGAPSFQALNLLSGSSTIGVMPVTKGGTAHSSFVAASMVYASSASVLSFIANGGADQPLVGNIGGPPSYQPLNLASNSSVINILSTSKGGTGNSGFIQYGVAYFETATQIGVVPSAAGGRVLTAHGSSAPTFDVVSITPTAVLSKSAAYTATTSDEVIVCDGSGGPFTIGLYDATGNSGRKISIKKSDALIGSSVITIDGSGAQTINTAATIKLSTQHEAVTLVSDGSNWQIIDRRIPKVWTAYTPTFTGFGTPSGVEFLWARDGANIIIKGNSGCGASTETEGRVSFPSGLASAATPTSISPSGHYYRGTTSTQHGGVVLVEPSSTYMTFGDNGTYGANNLNPLTKALGSAICNSSEIFPIYCYAPIAGWEG